MNQSIPFSELVHATPQTARAEENKNNWLGASQMWKRLGPYYEVEVVACEMILKATERAQLYRDQVLAEAGPEPDRAENPRAWCKWYDIMSDVYRKIYQ